MITISLCLIVKNEQNTLPRCLESISDAVDEIIIADTGSDDNTVKIARGFTDKVFHFKWIDDFSAARNYAFSKATMDYILWLDADDVISPKNKKKLIELKKSDLSAGAVMMKYNTAFDEDSNAVFSFYRERLIKRDCFVSWRGKVHETAEYTGETIYSDIEIDHLSQKKEYSRRNLMIYEKQISKGEKLSPRDIFYYARELYYHKIYDKAIKVFKDFLKNDGGWAENKIEACKILHYCYLEKGEYDKAFLTLTQSFLYSAPRSDICCLIGNILISKNEFKSAVFWFKLALNCKFDLKSGGFEDKSYQEFIPCMQLAVCYDRLKDYKQAEKYNEKAGRCRPNSKAYLYNLKYFENLHRKGLL